MTLLSTIHSQLNLINVIIAFMIFLSSDLKTELYIFKLTCPLSLHAGSLGLICNHGGHEEI